MKWNVKPAPVEPSEGTVRVIKKFAFVPTTVGQYRVWLESYSSRQVYVFDRLILGRKHYVWQELERFV